MSVPACVPETMAEVFLSPQNSPQYNNIPSDSIVTPHRSASHPAGWSSATPLLDRRDQLRSSAAFDVEIQPLDLNLQTAGATSRGTLLNYSSEGACVEHAAILEAPYVKLAWTDTHNRRHEAILRLRWCRSVGARCFLTGGRVVGVN